MTWIKDSVLIFVASLVLYLGFAAFRPLANPDEGRYSEIPREMISSGDYITPQLNGIDYFYKPPLFYWMQCASLKAFGYNRVSTRAASTLMGVFGILMAYGAGRYFFGRRAGILSAAVLATTLLYYIIAMIVTLDMTVSVFMVGAAFSFLLGTKQTGNARGWLIVSFFAFCALAVMTKGIIGILLPCGAAFFYALYKIFARKFEMPTFRDVLYFVFGVAVFFAITAPWHILASLANPSTDGVALFTADPQGQGFFWYYFVHEHFLRYIDPDTSRRAQPFWFFLVIAPAGALPWLFLLPRIVKDAFMDAQNGLAKRRDVFVFMFIWIVLIVGFFTASSSKLVPYIVGIYPAFAVVVGAWLASVWDRINSIDFKIEKSVISFLGVALVIAIPILYYIGERKYPDKVVSDFLLNYYVVATVVMGVAAAVVIVRGWGRGNNSRFWKGVFAWLALVLVAVNFLAILVQKPNSERLAAEIKRVCADEPFAIAFDYGYMQDLPFLLDKVPYYIGTPPEEQRFGWKRSPDKYSWRVFHNGELLGKFLRENGKIAAVARKESLNELSSFKLPLEVKQRLVVGDVVLFDLSLKNETK